MSGVDTAGRICVLNYTAGHGHMGCLSACYVLERGLKSIYGNDTEIEPIPVDFDGPPISAPESVEAFDDVIDAVRSWRGHAQAFAKADRIVLNAEGTLHWPSDNLRVWVLLALVEIAARDFTCPVSIVNAAVFSECPCFLDVCRRVFPFADAVAVRDHQSAATLTELGVTSVVRAADLTFLIPSQTTSDVRSAIRHARKSSWFEPAKGEKRVVLSGSSAVHADNQDDWLETFDDVISGLASSLGPLRVLCIGQRGMAGDVPVMHGLAKRHSDIITLITDELLPSEAIAMLEPADVVISGRYHVNTLSTVAGRPLVILPANSPKNRLLADELASDACAYLGSPSAPSIVEAALRVTQHVVPVEIRKHCRQLALKNLTVLGEHPSADWFDAEADTTEMLRQQEHFGRCKLLDRKARSLFAAAAFADEIAVKNRELLRARSNLECAAEDAGRLAQQMHHVQNTKAFRMASALQRLLAATKQMPRTIWKKLPFVRCASGGRDWPCACKRSQFRDVPLKVLHVSLSPLAGAPIRLCHLLDSKTEISALLITRCQFYADGREFDYDIVFNPETASDADRATVKRLIDECDLVHVHNEAYFSLSELLGVLPPEKPRCVQWHTAPDAMSVRLQQGVRTTSAWHDVPVLVIAQKHVRYYEHAIPVPNVIDIDAAPYKPVQRDSDCVRICYCPTDATSPHTRFCGAKGNDAILTVLKRIESQFPDTVRVDIIRRVPLDECLERKRVCHICIDDIESGGYHMNSLESLAMGSGVVGWLDQPMKQFLADYVGCPISRLPWFEATSHDLEARLAELINDRPLLDALGHQSRAWMERYWNRDFLETRYASAYRKVLATWTQQMASAGALRHMDWIDTRFTLAKPVAVPGVVDVLWDSCKVGVARTPERLLNAEKGDCFIVGTGPSINDLDFARLRNCQTIGVNGAIVKFDESGFLPDYYAISTVDFFANRFDLVRRCLEHGIPALFPFWGIAEIVRRDPSLLDTSPIYLISELNKLYGQPQKPLAEFDRNAEQDSSLLLHPTVRRLDVVGFSKDLAKGYFNGENIIYTALQIAYHLGYRRIFLLGMDLNYTGPNPRFYEGADDSRPSWVNDSYDRSIVPCFEIVRSICNDGELEVYNVCPGSRLPADIVPKITFDEALAMVGS